MGVVIPRIQVRAALAVLFLSVPAAVIAQEDGSSRRTAAAQATRPATSAEGMTPVEEAAQAEKAASAEEAATSAEGRTPADDEPLTFLDAVTVTATLRAAPVQDTPGKVSVIDEESIQERLVRDFADLVKYEPGVYVENNVTRLGLNGFNIRGIGGNRVLTQVDGVQTAEQFAFGPFSIHRAGLDVDVLKSVEIVRSANSALYGSDALGGVVSLFTKDPADYLRGRGFHLGAKTTWDGRAGELGGQFALATGTERIQGSLFASVNRGREIGNQGAVDTTDDTRTVPNPQDVAGSQLLAKLVVTPSAGNMLRTTAEVHDTRVETEWYSDRAQIAFGSLRYDTLDSDAVDTQNRVRVSLDHTLTGRSLDHVSWGIHGQSNDTLQVIDRKRLTLVDGALVRTLRHGTLHYEQAGYGGSLQIREHLSGPRDGVLLTAGGNFTSDVFDILRDRAETRAASGEPVPTDLMFPSKYFPESNVTEAGAYLQAEVLLGRVTLVPGLRYDRFALDANQQDPIYLAGLNPEAVDFGDAALSPKVGAAVRLNGTLTLHGQYAAGFRAPPYSAINTGFTSLRAGYTTLPNPDLRAERSDNLELGVRAALDRASVGATVFSNWYDGFIEIKTLGQNPATRLLEFRSENLEAAKISGLELRAEAYLGTGVTLRGSYARIEGVEILQDAATPALAESTPLGSVAPNEGVLGLRYVRPSGRWGQEFSVRLVESAAGRHAEDWFEPDGYAVADLVGFLRLADSLTFRFGVLNLTDAKYFEWWNVRGRRTNDPVIDRYSSPGLGVIGSVGYDW